MTNTAAQPSAFQKHFLNFDIDNYLNPITPRQRLDLLPRWISFWFGYRAPGAKSQPKLAAPGVWLSAFVGGFVGIAIITNVYLHLPLLSGHQAPIVIASFGAAAILEYNTIESPLSQPRNLIFGHFLSAVIGVAVTKGFERLPAERFDELRWLAGSTSVGLASAVMAATKTVHPPAGATALLASTTREITVLGWWLLPLVLLGSALMCASALIINNITRRWPLYWWTPADLSKKKPDVEQSKTTEEQTSSSSDSDSGRRGLESDNGSVAKWKTQHVERMNTKPAHTAPTGYHLDKTEPPHILDNEGQISITLDQIVLPKWWKANEREQEALQVLRESLQERQKR